MEQNATIFAIYSEYFGRKSSMLDAIDAYKDRKTPLEESEKIYALITITKLYCNAGFFPINLLEEEKEIYFKSEEGLELTLDFDNISTEKEKSMAILNALTLQSRYNGQKDKVQAVMADLNVEFKNGKTFEDLVNRFINTSEENKKDYSKKIRKFVNLLEEKNVNTYINLVFNEVLEDFEGR